LSVSALAAVKESIATLQTEEFAVDVAWQVQAQTVKARADAGDALRVSVECEGSDGVSVSMSKLRELEQKLSNLQADEPLVFPEVRPPPHPAREAQILCDSFQWFQKSASSAAPSDGMKLTMPATWT
jgi:hypothetical protein